MTDETTVKTIDEMLAEARAESEAESATDATLIEEETPPEPKRTTTRKRTGGRKRNLTEPLTDMYGTLGLAVYMLNQQDGEVIIQNAESMAASLVKWGDSDPKIYRLLERLTTTSAIGGVIAAHAPVILAIVSNHDLMPKLGGKNADKNSDSTTATAGTPPGFHEPGTNVDRNGGMGQASVPTPVIVGARLASG